MWRLFNYPFDRLADAISWLICEIAALLRLLETRTVDRAGPSFTYAQIREQHHEGTAEAGRFEFLTLTQYVNAAWIALIPMALYAGHMDLRYLKGTLAMALVLILASFIWLYFKRTQAGLMENVLGMIAVGNAEGLVLSTPGIWTDPWTACVLGLAVACWVAKALVLSVVQADLLETHNGLKRGALIGLHLGYSLSPALLGMGFLLLFSSHLPEDIQVFIDAPRKALAVPMLITAVLFILPGFWLTRKARRIARELIEA
jgi:hypothetical protein